MLVVTNDLVCVGVILYSSLPSQCCGPARVSAGFVALIGSCGLKDSCPPRQSCHFLCWPGGKTETHSSLTAERVSPLWVNLGSLSFLIILYFNLTQRDHSEMITQRGLWLHVLVCMHPCYARFLFISVFNQYMSVSCQ